MATVQRVRTEEHLEGVPAMASDMRLPVRIELTISSATTGGAR